MGLMCSESGVFWMQKDRYILIEIVTYLIGSIDEWLWIQSNCLHDFLKQMYNLKKSSTFFGL